MSRLKYDIDQGVKHQKIGVKKLIIAGAASLGMVGVAAIPAIAAQPTNPGCFGTDRAAWLAANSGAEWGVIASQDRAGDNAQINHDYMTTYCGKTFNN